MPVAQKIATVMKAVGYLKKDKTLSGGGNYAYLSEEKITAELHRECADIGLTFAPIAMEILDNREDKTNSGGLLHNTRILATFRFTDADDGTFLDVQTLGEGSDRGDKCLNKCMTGAYKYALRQSFMISTGNDPDDEPSQEATQSTRTGRTNGKAATTTAPPPPASDPTELDREKNSLVRELFDRDGYTAWCRDTFDCAPSELLPAQLPVVVRALRGVKAQRATTTTPQETTDEFTR